MLKIKYHLLIPLLLLFYFGLNNNLIFAEDPNIDYVKIKNAPPAVFENSFISIKLFKPNYVLPYYNNVSPDYEIYKDRTPNGVPLKRSEFKGQLSFLIPVVYNIYNSNISLNFAYTQLMFWQIYSKTQFFRETNYEPELFLRHYFLNNWETDVGIVHQSNGLGGDFERSWNRVYIQQTYKTSNFYISIKPWVLVFKADSSNLHNKDIQDYLGDGEINLAYKIKNLEISATLRNDFESNFKRGGNTFGLSYPLFSGFNAYISYFNGYGQSLIEYKHFSNSFGFGIILNNLI
ncbi:phospholipase A [Rickettsiales bacterium LUAb2]